MRVLILGGRGMLGSETAKRLRAAGALVKAPERARLDGCDARSAGEALDSFAPDWVVNCAAATDVDRCETQTQWARRLNAGIPALWAKLCRESGARFLQIGTDYVFDGRGNAPLTEEDAADPLNVYGATKYAGERATLSAGGTVLRVQWLYGRAKPGFVGWLCRQRQKSSIPVVADCTGVPTSAKEAARMIEALLFSGKTGLFHGAPAGAASWMEFAKEIFAQIGENSEKLCPISQTALVRPAKRPRYTPFSNEKLCRETGFSARPWQAVLEEFLQECANERPELPPGAWFD